MSIRSVGRRQARQAKSRGKWDSLSNKKGAEPRQAAPFKDSCANLSRREGCGLKTLRVKHRLVRVCAPARQILSHPRDYVSPLRLFPVGIQALIWTPTS